MNLTAPSLRSAAAGYRARSPHETMMVALAVNIGNLGPRSPARRPMADLVQTLDAAFRGQGQAERVRVFDFFVTLEASS
jgi:hypothetical protein